MRIRGNGHARLKELATPIAAALTPRLAGNGAKARKTKLAVMGLSADLLDAGDPRYAACIRLANAFRKARTKEMYELHGHVSSGVSALLASSAMALAAARFLYEAAAGSEGFDRPDLLSKAAKLSDSSRQNELSAWELCSREAVVRHRRDMNAVSLPWLTGGDGAKRTGPVGNEYKKAGRPRKDRPGVQVLNSPQEETWVSKPMVNEDAGHLEGPPEGSSQEGSGTD